MAQFTDSPYEYMMAGKPSARQARRNSPAPALSDKCRGCPDGRARPCIGYCIKDLLSDTRKRRNHETDT